MSDNVRREFTVSPIAAMGLIYSLIVGYFVHQRAWSSAAIMFSYGIALLGARLAQLIVRLERR